MLYRDTFQRRYGPWAVVAGASEGLGSAYARALAGRGLHLVLIARRRELLERLADEVRRVNGVDAVCLSGDLARTEFLEDVVAECSRLNVGLLVYNAAHAPIGEFADLSSEDLLGVVDVNLRGPVTLVRALLPPMVAQGAGGIVLMTSLAGNQGSPYIAAYAASKAFTRVLAEGLWYEVRDSGVDVVACCAGAVRTPGYTAAAHGGMAAGEDIPGEGVPGKDAPGTLDPDEVVEQTLRALGRGPVVIPGRVNRIASAFMTRLLPRRTAITIMARNTGSLVPVGRGTQHRAPLRTSTDTGADTTAKGGS